MLWDIFNINTVALLLHDTLRTNEFKILKISNMSF